MHHGAVSAEAFFASLDATGGPRPHAGANPWLCQQQNENNGRYGARFLDHPSDNGHPYEYASHATLEPKVPRQAWNQGQIDGYQQQDVSAHGLQRDSGHAFHRDSDYRHQRDSDYQFQRNSIAGGHPSLHIDDRGREREGYEAGYLSQNSNGSAGEANARAYSYDGSGVYNEGRGGFLGDDSYQEEGYQVSFQQHSRLGSGERGEEFMACQPSYASRETNSQKRRRSRWGPESDEGEANETEGGAKKRKSRWAADEPKVALIGQIQLPHFVKELTGGMDLDPELQALNFKLLDLNRKLETGHLIVDRGDGNRSASPEPIYDNAGMRINTREHMAREKLIRERQDVISQLVKKNRAFKPPADYKPPKHYKKLYIPVKEYPGYNFIGLIIGPRGNTQKRMEKETGSKIVIRGKGSVKEGRLQQKRDVKPDPSDNEDLHVLVEADTADALEKAADMVEKLLVPVEEGRNKHKQAQLLELAILNGTIRDDEYCCLCGEPGHRQYACPARSSGCKSDVSCRIYADGGHPTGECTLKGSGEGYKMDDEYKSFLAELGGGNGEDGGTSCNGGGGEVGSSRQAGTTFNLMGRQESSGRAWSGGGVGASPGFGSAGGPPRVGSSPNERVMGMSGRGGTGGNGMGGVYPRPDVMGPPMDSSGGGPSLGMPPQPGFGGNMFFQQGPEIGTAAVSKFSKDGDNSNLYVGYLPNFVDDEGLMRLFAPFGRVQDCKVIRDRLNGSSKGYGFVRFTGAAAAADAVARMNGYRLDGKTLVVRVAGRPPPPGAPSGLGGPSSHGMNGTRGGIYPPEQQQEQQQLPPRGPAGGPMASDRMAPPLPWGPPPAQPAYNPLGLPLAANPCGPPLAHSPQGGPIRGARMPPHYENPFNAYQGPPFEGVPGGFLQGMPGGPSPLLPGSLGSGGPQVPGAVPTGAPSSGVRPPASGPSLSPLPQYPGYYAGPLSSISPPPGPSGSGLPSTWANNAVSVSGGQTKAVESEYERFMSEMGP